MTTLITAYEERVPAAWDLYVDGHERGTWYHGSRWKRLIETTFGHPTIVLAATRGDRWVGVLPLTYVANRLFGRFLVSVAYSPYGGICADDEEASRELLAAAKALTRDRKLDFLEIRGIDRLDDPELHLKTSKQTFWLELKHDAEAMTNSFRREIRNRNRKAIALGCTAHVAREEFLSDFYGLFCRRMRELGTPVYGRAWFEHLLEIYGDQVAIVAIRAEGQVIAAGIMVMYDESLAVPWICSTSEFFHFYPNNILYMEAIRYAISKGCKVFDFGSSNAGSGNASFKERWGAESIQLHWHYYLNRRRKIPDLRSGNARISLATQTWCRLPLPLTNWLGPKITRGTP